MGLLNQYIYMIDFIVPLFTLNMKIAKTLQIYVQNNQYYLNVHYKPPHLEITRFGIIAVLLINISMLSPVDPKE